MSDNFILSIYLVINVNILLPIKVTIVSSDKDRIEQAKSDWGQGKFDRVTGDGEFIPLPDK